MGKTVGGNTLKKTRKSTGSHKNHSSIRDDFEVEYKEFTVSELLEIRKKIPSSSSKTKGEPGGNEKQGVSSPEELAIRKKKRIVILIFVLFCLLGAFFMMKYFLY